MMSDITHLVLPTAIIIHLKNVYQDFDIIIYLMMIQYIPKEGTKKGPNTHSWIDWDAHV